MYCKSTENWMGRLKEQGFGPVPFFMETHVKPNKLRNEKDIQNGSYERVRVIENQRRDY